MDGKDTTARIAARIAERAAREHADRRLDELLADKLPGNALTSLLVHVMRRRALARSWADVLAHAERTAATHPSSADARRLHALEGAFFDAARAFQAVALAPVEPIGTSARAGVDPNHVLTAIRHFEVASDPTAGLALLAARQRRAGAKGAMRYCASQRVLRLTPFENPDFSPHFGLCALATSVRATRAAEDDACEREALREQLETWARVFELAAQAGFAKTKVRFVISDTRIVRAVIEAHGHDPDALARGARAVDPAAAERVLAGAGLADLPREVADLREAVALPRRAAAIAAGLADEVAAPLRARGIDVHFDGARLQGLRYYTGPFVQILVRRDDGVGEDALELPIGDGGATSWMRALLSDHRERFVSTGGGVDVFVKLFDTNAGASRAP